MAPLCRTSGRPVSGGTAPSMRREGLVLDIRQVDSREGLVQIRKRDLERLTTEVMQLREFLPKVVNGDLIEMLQKARAAETMKERLGQEQEQLRHECLHLRSRLDAAQSECQKEREEKLVLREQLWESREQLQQQAEFCTGLGAASCTLLWSTSSKEEAVKDILADGKLQSFLSVAGQTLESFVKSLDGEAKAEQQDSNSHEHQFVLALAGVVTNVAAVTCGRDYLSSSAHVLLETLMQLLELLKPGVFPKLKVLMLMALYNVSISVKGLKYIREFPGLLTLIWTLLEDGDSEVCLHALRLLQSVLLEEAVSLVGPGLLLDDPLLPLERIRMLATSSRHPALRQTAQETLDDLGSLRASFLDPHGTSSSDQNVEVHRFNGLQRTWQHRLRTVTPGPSLLQRGAAWSQCCVPSAHRGATTPKQPDTFSPTGSYDDACLSRTTQCCLPSSHKPWIPTTWIHDPFRSSDDACPFRTP
ncbi:heat shock factor 2-binding protein-like [Salvelinus namaycush]|uniref:Heat shock factor 2-binding protein-like n=1 Tax=Salvelinus namaycush TaxID=8040 RepID=A0A8U0R151_SALNM|nr:heat shock factor 2-binding protein-like [Salvelinus namaycush]